MTGLMEEQLPVMMAGDANLVRFVELVDPIISELYDRVGEKQAIFDPTTAPPAMVRWLAGVLALPLEDDLAPIGSGRWWSQPPGSTHGAAPSDRRGQG